MADEDKTTGLLNNPGAISETDPTSISSQAQDVAKAQGVSYSDIGKTQTDIAEKAGTAEDPYTTPSYNASATSTALEAEDGGVKYKDAIGTEDVPGYVDQDKSTVAGQLNSLLSADSKYIQQAEARGRQEAASRGLLSSSISAGAARREAINAALPIAQQDAQTYAQAQAKQQEAEYGIETIKGEAIVSGQMVEQKAQIDRQAQSIDNAFKSAMTGAAAQDKAWMQDMQNTFNTSMKELEHVQNMALQNTQISAERAAQIREQSSAIMQNYQISVENMLTDPDFLGTGTDAVNNALEQTRQLAANGIMFLGSAAGMETAFKEYVAAYLDPTVLDADWVVGEDFYGPGAELPVTDTEA